MRVLETAKVTDSELSTIQNRPEFRRASKNMMLSWLAVSRVLDKYPDIDKSKLGVVLATNYGELAITQEFLQTLCLSQMARPFLFQNSLHNATLGFLGLQFGLTGPSFTISNGVESGENAKALAETLQADCACKYVLEIMVDSVLEGFTPSIAESAATAVLYSAV